MTTVSGGVSLGLLLQALGATVATAVVTPTGTDGVIGSVVLLEPADLGAPSTSGDLALLIGVPADDAAAWLDRLASVDREQRPLAAATKQLSSELRDAADRARVALVAVHPQARIELVLATVRSLLDGGAGQAVTGDAADEPLVGENDLYGLAQTVAALTGGLVSIEDEHSRLLAYSATDGAADELRMLSILGRAGPADYLRRLRQRGVFDRLRAERRAIEVPADDELGWRRRLVVDIRALGEGEGLPRAGAGASLGTIWVQEGNQALDSDAESVLEGAAAIAARLIERARSAPTQEALQIQRLLGLRGGGVDIPSLAAALSLPTTGPAAVIGLAPLGAPITAWPGATPIADLAAAVRLHASAYAPESLVATTDLRIYVLLPRVRVAALPRWVAGMLDRVRRRTALELRAAVAAPVVGLDDVGAARAEVDRVLDRPGSHRVTSLARSRTSVLLGEIADLVAAQPQLRDPRLQELVDDDAARDGALVTSLERYLEHFGDVRSAAASLHIHPNTLRYRIRRAEQVLDMRVSDPDDRLLLQVELLGRRRRV